MPLYRVGVSADREKVEVYDERRVMLRTHFLRRGAGKGCACCSFAVERSICEATGCTGVLSCYAERDHVPRNAGMTLNTGLGPRSHRKRWA
jgi:hypothetical protein